MYTVVVEPPGVGADSFFSEDFSDDDLQDLVDADVIGPDNLPLYVSSVVYGRMMLFTMTSTASAEDIRAALQASYDSYVVEGEFDLESEYGRTLRESSVTVTTLGGDARDAQAIIKSGDWASYFDEEASLSTAEPLEFTFKNLGDSSIASVSETTEYTVKTCAARAAAPGVFDIVPAQAYDLGVASISEVVVADHNGDGYDDLVFNARGATNAVRVLHANGEGTGVFELGPEFTHSEVSPPGGWSEYGLRVGDVDGDDATDLVWNYNRDTGTERVNALYVARAKVDEASGFVESAQQFENPSIAAGSYPFYLGDVNGDGMADVLWNSVPVRADYNYTHVGVSLGDGTFRVDDGVAQSHSSPDGWAAYTPVVADFNGDGLTDIIWNALSSDRDDVHSFFARDDNRDINSDALPLDAVFQQGTLFQWPGDSSGYFLTTGDVDGDGSRDLAWVKPDSGANSLRIDTALNTGTGFASAPESRTDYQFPDDVDIGDTVEAQLADVAGDDKADLIVNNRNGLTNLIAVGLAAGDGTFDFTPAWQTISAGDELTSWSQYTMLLGNFGGSAKQDVVWVLPTQNAAVYVAIAK